MGGGEVNWIQLLNKSASRHNGQKLNRSTLISDYYIIRVIFNNRSVSLVLVYGGRGLPLIGLTHREKDLLSSFLFPAGMA